MNYYCYYATKHYIIVQRRRINISMYCNFKLLIYNICKFAPVEVKKKQRIKVFENEK